MYRNISQMHLHFFDFAWIYNLWPFCLCIFTLTRLNILLHWLGLKKCLWQVSLQCKTECDITQIPVCILKSNQCSQTKRFLSGKRYMYPCFGRLHLSLSNTTYSMTSLLRPHCGKNLHYVKNSILENLRKLKFFLQIQNIVWHSQCNNSKQCLNFRVKIRPFHRNENWNALIFDNFGVKNQRFEIFLSQTSFIFNVNFKPTFWWLFIETGFFNQIWTFCHIV